MEHRHHHHHGTEDEKLEEILEDIWMKFEDEGKSPEDTPIEQVTKLTSDTLQKLEKKGWIERKEEGTYLSAEGYERARSLIRSHRLAERLLADVLNFEDEQVEQAACRYEHMLDEDALDSVCILLGHPRTCPHGRAIPEGRCCTEGAVEFRPLVVRLSELDEGEEAVVEYIGTRDSSRMAYLTSLGFTGGKKLRLLRKRPAYLVRVEETDIALDKSIADEVFVRPRRRKSVQRRRRRGWFFR